MENVPPGFKRCTGKYGCGDVKAVTEFYERDGPADGLSYSCKGCLSKRTAELQAQKRRVSGVPERKVLEVTPDGYKRCGGKCGELKRLDEFPERGDGHGGTRSECYECKNLSAAVYRETHREQINTQAADYREVNTEALAERQRQWALDHPEAYAEIHRKWKQANKELVNAGTWRRRYAIEANGGVIITAEEWIALKARYGGHCLGCGETPAELCYDHVVPCSPPHNGRTDVANGQPLCRSCNSKKHTKVLDLRGELDGVRSPYDLRPDLPVGTVDLSMANLPSQDDMQLEEGAL